MKMRENVYPNDDPDTEQRRLLKTFISLFQKTVMAKTKTKNMHSMSKSIQNQAS